MKRKELQRIFEQVAAGELSVEQAMVRSGMAPYEDLGFAKIDHHRSVRQGVGEVIYGAGKPPEQIRDIAADLRSCHRCTHQRGVRANFGSLSALLSMLNFCASGVSVVNIDNGFGAGYPASIINHL